MSTAIKRRLWFPQKGVASKAKSPKNRDFVFGGVKTSAWTMMVTVKGMTRKCRRRVSSMRVFRCSKCLCNRVVVVEAGVTDIEDATNRGASKIVMEYELRCSGCGHEWEAQREVNV